MRLLYVTRRYWPSVGGIESYVRHVARALAVRHSVTVVVAEPDDPAAEPYRDGDVEVVPLRLPARNRALLQPLRLSRAPGLRRYAYGRGRLAMSQMFAAAVAPAIAAADLGSDLVHMWGGDMLGAAALRAARRLHAPYVTTPFAHRGQWGDDPASAATYRRADRVVALLDADADVYRGLGVPDAKIDVLGVCSPGVEAGGGAELRRRHGIDGRLVLFLGDRRPYKGCGLLLESAELVAERRRDVTFAFVGPGDPLPPSNAPVLDVGRVDEDARAAWLEAADLLCLPSEGEILPGSFLEAWSVETPVLTSDIPTLRELIERSGGGRVCERDRVVLAECLDELLADDSSLRGLGASGHDYWRSYYSLDPVVAAHESLYGALAVEQGAAA